MGAMPTSGAASAIAEAVSRVPPGQVELNGSRYMPDAKGALVPIELVKEQHKLQDQTVRRLLAGAEQVAAKIAHFKALAFSDVDQLQGLLAEKYGAKVGGAKGNVSLFTYDGLVRIQVQVADLIKFGPELQVARNLVEECVGEWTEGARAELRAIVMNAFTPDKEGQMNRGALLGLRRLDIQDERWTSAMKAISDAVQVIGSTRYIRFSRRETLNAPWEEISLNVATAKPPLQSR